MIHRIRRSIFRIRQLGFLPNNAAFFDLFQKQVDEINFAAQKLLELVNNSHDPEKRKTLHKAIKDAERRGDDLVRELSALIMDSITTPFPRQDIHTLGQILDDTLDGIEGATDTIVNFRILNPSDRLKLMVGYIAEDATILQGIIKYLRRFDHPIDIYEAIRTLEHDADKINKVDIAEAFLSSRTVDDVVSAIAFSRAIGRLENTADLFRLASDFVKGVISKRV
ncbi:MAG: DUF47 family protein [Patescibacteria group bacterium]